MRALGLILVGLLFMGGLGIACARSSEAGKERGPGRASGAGAASGAGHASGSGAAATYRIETLTLTPQPALTMRAQVAPAELEARMNELMTRLVGYAMLKQIELAGPPFARYHARTAELVDVEAGIPTVKPMPGDAALGIQGSELPAGPAIATVHRGAYEALPAAHAALARWARKQGRTPGGGAWEVFLTNPMQERDPTRWRTKVFLPLAE